METTSIYGLYFVFCQKGSSRSKGVKSTFDRFNLKIGDPMFCMRIQLRKDRDLVRQLDKLTELINKSRKST